MAILSNINGKFAVDSTGAIQFSGAAGTSGYVLKSTGSGTPPTWVAASTVIGGPYLPLIGGTLTGSTATASGISFTVGGILTLQGAGSNTTTFDTSGTQLIIKNSTYSTATGLALRSSNDTWQMQLYASGGGTDYGFLASEWGAWNMRKNNTGGLYLNNNNTYFVQPEGTSNMNGATFNQFITMSSTQAEYGYINLGATSTYGWQIGKGPSSGGVVGNESFYIYNFSNSTVPVEIDTSNNFIIFGQNNGYDGTLQVGARAYFQHRDAGQTTTSILSTYNNDNTTLNFRLKGVSDADAQMTIKGSGKVGIGNSTPNNKLSVQTGTDSRLEVWGGSTYAAIQSVNDANTVLKDMRFDASTYNFIGTSATFQGDVTTVGDVLTGASISLGASNGRVTALQGIFGTAFALTSNGYATFGSTSSSVPIAFSIDGDGTDAALFIDTDNDANFSDNLEVRKNAYQYFYNGGYISKPYGGDFITSSPSFTGAIEIRLPTGGTGYDDMIKFVVDIYDYSTQECVTVFIGGYTYQNVGGNTWTNPSATVFANLNTQNHTVRFGDNGSVHCVWIGDTNSTWSYPQIIVRDFFCGYGASIGNWTGTWDISFVTTQTTVNNTLTNNFPLCHGGSGGTFAGNVTFDGATTTFNSSSTVFNIDADSVLAINNAGTDAVGIYAASGDTIYLGGNNTWQMYFATNNYCYSRSWLNIGAAAGIYSSTNGAHWYPNANSTYGTWQMHGSRNGYYGIAFYGMGGTGDAAQHLMGDASGNIGIWSSSNSSGWPFYYNRSHNCVGIGSSTTSSSYVLQANGSAHITGGLYTAGNVQAGISGTGDYYLGGLSGNYFRFHTNNSDTYFDMNCGNLNWRQGASTRYIFYSTTANMTIYGTLTQGSDIRIKENIVEIGNCIDKVKSIRGVYYNRTDFNTEPTKIGVIAQEVEEQMPELVHDEPTTGIKSVSYTELTAVLVNAIKEQQVIIDDLKSRIETLEK